MNQRLAPSLDVKVMQSGPRTLASHFGRSYRISVITLLICLAIIGLAIILAIRYEIPRASAAARAQRLATSSHEAMLQQQSLLYGYLLTRDDRFLQHYRASGAELTNINLSITKSIDRSESNSEKLLQTRLDQQTWTRLADELIQTTTRQNAITEFSATPELLETVNNAFVAYQLDSDQLKTALERQRVISAHNMYIAIGVPVAIAVILLMGNIVFLRREQRMLGELVLTPVAQLQAIARDVAEGNLNVTVEPTGVSDLRSLGEDINLMTSALAAENQRVQSDIEVVAHKTGQLRELLDFVRSAGTCSNMNELRDFLCNEARQLANAKGVSLNEFTIDEHLSVTCMSGAIDITNDDTKIFDKAIATGQILNAGNFIVVPLVHSGRVIGLMQFVGEVKTLDEELLELIAIQAATALTTARSHDEIEYLSEHDPLTDALNRRRFDVDLDFELQRATRYGTNVTLMMVDLDYFKSVNDDFGHQTGDQLLRAVANAIHDSLRSTDSAYRYGGEEFAIIARSTDLDNSLPLAARTKEMVEAKLMGICPASITLSIGIACAPESGRSALEIVGRADAALYKAKELGRNRIVSVRHSNFVETT